MTRRVKLVVDAVLHGRSGLQLRSRGQPSPLPTMLDVTRSTAVPLGLVVGGVRHCISWPCFANGTIGDSACLSELSGPWMDTQ